MTLTDAQKGRLARGDGARPVKVRGKACEHVWTAVTTKSLDGGAVGQFRCPECGVQRKCVLAYERPAKRVCRYCGAFLSQATPLDEDRCSPCRRADFDRDVARLMAEEQERTRFDEIIDALPGTLSEIAERTGLTKNNVQCGLRDLRAKGAITRTGRPGRGGGAIKGRVVGGYTYRVAEAREDAA